MSRSSFRLSIEYAMLDGRKECVPGFEDSSGGHIMFKSIPCRLKLVGPGSSTFDGISWDADGNPISLPYDREEWVNYMVEKFKEEAIRDAHFGGLLKLLFGNVFDQAKAHCDANHIDQRIRFGVMCADHDEKLMCHCDCHGKLLVIHDHACCSKCDKCEFKTRCDCSHCSR